MLESVLVIAYQKKKTRRKETTKKTKHGSESGELSEAVKIDSKCEFFASKSEAITKL